MITQVRIHLIQEGAQLRFSFDDGIKIAGNLQRLDGANFVALDHAVILAVAPDIDHHDVVEIDQGPFLSLEGECFQTLVWPRRRTLRVAHQGEIDAILSDQTLPVLSIDEPGEVILKDASPKID